MLLPRRDFLLAASGLLLPLAARRQDGEPVLAAPCNGELDDLPQRVLGKTGRTLPILGLGCFPLGGLEDEDAAVAVVRRALESGARYFDTAPSYHDGASERRVGKGLKEHARDELYVATKTLERDGDKALHELERSLERLGMEYVDCVQVHEVRSDEDVETLFAKGGVVEALESAREKKKLRFVGITAHKDPAVLVKACERHDFATALVPINPLDPKHASFVKEFLPTARAKELGVIAMKIYAGGALVGEGRKVQPGELVRWALAQDGVTLAIPGADTVPYWDEARYAAAQPLPNEKEQARIVEAVGAHQGKKSEWYKRD
ncbi:MAG: aldo/keto reductase [Planctomycetes bacterium]|nr:aldo/keto reductase [Planctomycetota bacterium]